MIHLRYTHSDHGPIPLCGQAMWDTLTDDPNRNECWECASIAGAYSPDLQQRFGLNADGSPRTCDTCGKPSDELDVEGMCPDCLNELEKQ